MLWAVRSTFWYRLGFAVVNWLEATVELLALGQINLAWCFKYARWHALRRKK